ncbi:hypothetical protein EC991_010350 [Linnemannia zychae]|nr:hypothetical protein EC991_010350 [Linnemannia zychae]
MRSYNIALLGCLIAASFAAPVPENGDSIKDTCTNLSLAADKHTLTASCISLDGSSKESSIDLNEFIGNDNGRFKWASRDFINDDSVIHPLRDVTFLEGFLKDGIGFVHPATLDLAENIRNVDGTLTYIGE